MSSKTYHEQTARHDEFGEEMFYDNTIVALSFQGGPDALLVVDGGGCVLAANPACVALFGASESWLVEHRLDELISDAGPGDAAVVTVARRRDGALVPVDVTSGTVEAVNGTLRVVAVRDARARVAAEHALRRRIDALTRSNDQLQQFAYIASHDLQEPLRMVSSYLQLVERRYQPVLDDDGREFIAFAVDGARRMQALINDLLLFSRIGSPQGSLTRVDLNETVRTVHKDLEVRIRETGAVLRVDLLPTIVADPGQMRQLFQNLFSNALKFHKPGEAPDVHIWALWQGNGWTFSVRDTGIGMDPQYRQRIFHIFQRLHTRVEYPGTGIGLAICRRIAEQHGGQIDVETELGVGTTFHVRLPLRSAP
jgi:signal transduction histidine kinase